MLKLAIRLDCSGNLVDRNTPSYSFYRTFPNSVEKEMSCEMEIDNGGWIVSTKFKHTYIEIVVTVPSILAKTLFVRQPI